MQLYKGIQHCYVSLCWINLYLPLVNLVESVINANVRSANNDIKYFLYNGHVARLELNCI